MMKNIPTFIEFILEKAKVPTATYKSISSKLSNKQKYNEVIKALKDLELIDNYGTVEDPYEIMSSRYPDPRNSSNMSIAQYIIKHGEISVDGYDYGIIIDLNDDMLYVDYPAKYWKNIKTRYRIKGDLSKQNIEEWKIY